jgi:hypothetical protein
VYNMETAQVNKNNQFFIDCVHQIQIWNKIYYIW